MNRSLVVFIGLLFAMVIVAPAKAKNDDDPVQRAALMAFYYSTVGPYWMNGDGWGSTSSICTWFGVSCDENDDVVQLDLERNNLSGTIPREVGNLSNLRRLRIHNNRLVGSIPPELGNLSELRQLIIEINNLSGAIPPELGNLSNLALFIAGNNGLSGPIPPELGNLNSVHYLDLKYNDLNGTIPAAVSNMSSLVSLVLSYNPDLTCWETYVALLWAMDLPNYQGPQTACAPDETIEREALEALYTSTDGPNWVQNDGWGSTSSYCAWFGISCLGEHSVMTLSLPDNNLNGKIPPEIGDLTNLESLLFNSNQITGTIPTELGNLINLEQMSLSANNLSGPIPSALSNLDYLTNLNLTENPELTCWVTFAALIWAWGLPFYEGPELVCGVEISDSYLPYIFLPN